MDPDKMLKGKKLLIVDDEPDILDSLTELLSVAMIDRATTFEEAKDLLETNYYDTVILDIMGVDGFELLKIANKGDVPALMFTAHALNKDSLKKSAEEGASYYVPKDEINRIDVFVADVLEAREKGENPWAKWVHRLGPFFDENTKFGGPNWREEHRKFWDEKLKHSLVSF
jgi:DNA-binding NtrC family response regulator